MGKELSVQLYGTEYKITRIGVERYQADNILAIQLYCLDEEFGIEEPFATLTVCLDVTRLSNRPVKKNEAFLDTNNCPWAEEFVKKYKLGTPTDMTMRSGYCTYPLYKWDIEELEKYKEA